MRRIKRSSVRRVLTPLLQVNQIWNWHNLLKRLWHSKRGIRHRVLHHHRVCSSSSDHFLMDRMLVLMPTLLSSRSSSMANRVPYLGILTPLQLPALRSSSSVGTRLNPITKSIASHVPSTVTLPPQRPPHLLNPGHYSPPLKVLTFNHSSVNNNKHRHHAILTREPSTITYYTLHESHACK